MSTNKQVSSTIIYGIEDRPPFKEAFFAALQHLLAILDRLDNCQITIR